MCALDSGPDSRETESPISELWNLRPPASGYGGQALSCFHGCDFHDIGGSTPKVHCSPRSPKTGEKRPANFARRR
jgi:hypothetical protein